MQWFFLKLVVDKFQSQPGFAGFVTGVLLTLLMMGTVFFNVFTANSLSKLSIRQIDRSCSCIYLGLFYIGLKM